MYLNHRQRSTTRCSLQLQITTVCPNLSKVSFYWPKVFYFRLARAKSHAIFSDRELNSERVIYLNIYQNLLLTAMKMHEYIRDWGVSGRKNTTFLRSEFQTLVQICLLTVPCGRGHRTNDRVQLFDCSGSGAAERPQGRRCVGNPQGSCGMVWYSAIYNSKPWYWWYSVRLGNHAFYHILSRKPTNYKALLIWLSFEMRRAKYRQYHRRFKSLVKEAQAVFREILTW